MLTLLPEHCEDHGDDAELHHLFPGLLRKGQELKDPEHWFAAAVFFFFDVEQSHQILY